MAQYVTLVYTLPRIAGAITAAAPPSAESSATAATNMTSMPVASIFAASEHGSASLDRRGIRIAALDEAPLWKTH